VRPSFRVGPMMLVPPWGGGGTGPSRGGGSAALAGLPNIAVKSAQRTVAIGSRHGLTSRAFGLVRRPMSRRSHRWDKTIVTGSTAVSACWSVRLLPTGRM